MFYLCLFCDILEYMKCELCSMDATYRIIDDRGLMHFYCDHHAPKGAQKIGTTNHSVWKTYKALIVLLGVVVIATIFTVLITKNGISDTQNIHRWLMGYFFLVFGVSKSITWGNFARSFIEYDPLAGKIPLYAQIYPAIELGLAGLFLSGVWVSFASWVTIIVLGITTLGVFKVIQKGEHVQCVCLGTWTALPLGWVTVLENAVMIGMAILMIMV